MKNLLMHMLVISLASVAGLSLAVCSMHPQSTQQSMIALLVLGAVVLTVLSLKGRIGRAVIVPAVLALVGVNLGDNFHNRPAVTFLTASLGLGVAQIRPRWLLIAIVVTVSAYFCHLHGSYVDIFPRTNSALADYVRWTLNDPILSSTGAVALMITLEASLRAVERQKGSGLNGTAALAEREVGAQR